MKRASRREFLADVGRGMVVAAIGPAAAAHLELAPAFAGEEAAELSFGPLEPLAGLLEETPLESGLSRNTAALATSSISTLRPSGDLFATWSRISVNPEMPRAASVLRGPAERALTLICRLPRSTAR